MKKSANMKCNFEGLSGNDEGEEKSIILSQLLSLSRKANVE
jgi:hypothetical protein